MPIYSKVDGKREQAPMSNLWIVLGYHRHRFLSSTPAPPPPPPSLSYPLTALLKQEKRGARGDHAVSIDNGSQHHTNTDDDVHTFSLLVDAGAGAVLLWEHVEILDAAHACSAG